VAALGRNDWQLSPGTGGRNPAEWVAGLARNTQIAKELNFLGISRSTLFPDLEGITRELIEKYSADDIF
jgi:hypothetical protein